MNFKKKIALILPIAIALNFNVQIPAKEVTEYTITLDMTGKDFNLDDYLVNGEYDSERLLKDLGLTLDDFETETYTIQEEEEEVKEEEMQASEPIQTSSIVLPNRRLTEKELQEWIEEYEELGGVSEFELEVVKLVNIEREKEGLQPLEISDALMKSARFKSQEMVDLDYFSHTSPIYVKDIPLIFRKMLEDRNQSEQYNLQGDDWSIYGAGENLGRGYSSPEVVVKGWMNSVGHKRAILDDNAKTVGVGRVFKYHEGRTDIGGTSARIWTINFGY